MMAKHLMERHANPPIHRYPLNRVGKMVARVAYEMG